MTIPKDQSYTRGFETRLIDRYLEILGETDPATAQRLSEKSRLSVEGLHSSSRGVKNRRMKSYLATWEKLNGEEQLSFSSHDAKINQMARLARTMATTDIVQAHNSIRSTTAGSFDFVLARFRDARVTPSQLQEYMDANAVAWFSLTGHPTNPTTVAFTKAMIGLARILSQKGATALTLDASLRRLRDTPIVGERKTPLDEAEEILATLDVLFDTALPHKRLIEQGLAASGYGDEGVAVRKALIRPCAWTLGDGDGNAFLTESVLAEGIELHRSKIASRYADFVKIFAGDDVGLLKLADELSDAAALAASGVDAVIARIEDMRGSRPERSGDLADLIYLMRCFGFGFGTIDLRHNAEEIVEAALGLLNAAGLSNAHAGDEQNLDALAARFGALIDDDAAIEKLRAFSPDDLRRDGFEAAARIFGRLQVIGRNPDMCEKFIIAETTHRAQVMAVLLLMKASGNIVGETGSRIDVTVLSESVKDLAALGGMLGDLLDDQIYRRHAASRGELLLMIAKSDTTRQDGRGEAEYMQYETAIDIYRVADEKARMYPELHAVRTSIMNGGGHALQRGGGRVTEIAALHGRAAADARAVDCGPSTLTIQGEQLTIIFCPGNVALGSLEAFVSQNLYTKAGVRGEMPMPRHSKSVNRVYAADDAWLYARVAGKAFDRMTKKSSAIDELLVHAPWLAMKAGNVSSRPAKRGEKQTGPGITPAEAKGKNPRALQGRAISGERLTAHACLPVFSVLGLLEAMEAVARESRANQNDIKYGDALHHLYRAHKIHRDGARVTINAVQMADFDIAWPLLTGRMRPGPKDTYLLAEQFDPDGDFDAAATLAYLEIYFLRVEIQSFEMISGQKARKSFRWGDALRRLWPELAEEVDYRNAHAEFARVIECYRTRQFDRHDLDALTEQEYRITQALYASANVVNAPVGILATRTRLEPVEDYAAGRKTRVMKPKSFGEEKVRALLHLPDALN